MSACVQISAGKIVSLNECPTYKMQWSENLESCILAENMGVRKIRVTKYMKGYCMGVQDSGEI